MIQLESTDLLRVITSSTSPLDAYVAWTDTATGAVTPSRSMTSISTATTTTIVAAPASGTDRKVRSVELYNRRGGAAQTVEVQVYNGTAFALFSTTLEAGELLEYQSGAGWRVLSANDGVKMTGLRGPAGPAIALAEAGFLGAAAAGFAGPRTAAESRAILGYAAALQEPQSQAAWYIDWENGDDANAGSDVAPIKTQAEWRLRTGGVALVDVSIFILGTEHPEEGMIWDTSGPGFITVRGERGAVLHTGTMSSVTTWNGTAETRGEFTDSSLPVSWTASDLLGKPCYLTSGDFEGYQFWTMDDLTGRRTWISPPTWTSDVYAGADWAPIFDGDTFEVREMPTRLSGRQTISGKNLLFADLCIGDPRRGLHLAHQSGVTSSATFYNCAVCGVDFDDTSASYSNGCYVTEARLNNAACAVVWENSAIVGSFGWYAGALSIYNCCANIDTPLLCGGIGPYSGINCSLLLGAGAIGLATFGPTGYLVVGRGGFADLTQSKLWGTLTAAPYGVNAMHGSRVLYGAAIAIAGATVADAIVAGSTKSYAQLPYTDTAKLTGVIQVT